MMRVRRCCGVNGEDGGWQADKDTHADGILRSLHIVHKTPSTGLESIQLDVRHDTDNIEAGARPGGNFASKLENGHTVAIDSVV
jgi:hypothetical protein